MFSIRPRRRWFQFSLGSLLLVMTLVAVWLSWQIGFIRERQVWLAKNSALVNQNPTRQATIPVWRRMLGDVAVAEISFPLGFDAAEVVRIKRWFPEATVAPSVGSSPTSVVQLSSMKTGWSPTTSNAARRGLAWVAAQRAAAAAAAAESETPPASEQDRRIREQRKRLMNTIDIPEKKFPTLDDPGTPPREPVQPLFRK